MSGVEIGGYFVVAHFDRRMLTLEHFSNVFFRPINFTSQVCICTKFWACAMFHLMVFNIDIHKNRKSNHEPLSTRFSNIS